MLEKDKAGLENDKWLLEQEVQKSSRTEIEMKSRFNAAQREKIEIKTELHKLKKVFFHLEIYREIFVHLCWAAHMHKFTTKSAHDCAFRI